MKLTIRLLFETDGRLKRFLKDKNSVLLGIQPHGFLEHRLIAQIYALIQQFSEVDFEPRLVEYRKPLHAIEIRHQVHIRCILDSRPRA